MIARTARPNASPQTLIDDVGNGPPVVLLHGVGDERVSFRPIVRRLCQQYRCIAADLHGRGGALDRSERDEQAFSMAEYAEEISLVLDRLGVCRPVLVGHDLGGVVAAHLAARREVRAVVCVDQVLDLVAWAMFLDDRREWVSSFVETLPEIRAPFLAIHGSEPGLDYRMWLAERLPRASVEVWPGGGHYPHLSDPDRFAARIAQLSP